MNKHSLLVFATLCIAACARTDTPAGAAGATLVPAPGPISYEFFADGRIAYSKFVEGKAAIYVSNGDGSNAKRVSFGVWDGDPYPSPDGKLIAITRDAGGHGDVIIVPSDSGAERVVAASPANEGVRGWLADGSGLLFGKLAEKGAELWLFDLKSATSTKLFDVNSVATASASPDGKWIAYGLTKAGKSTVWLYDREKKTHKQMTTDGFEDLSFACFSPDSRSLLYNTRRTGTWDVWRLDVATGERHQLTQDVADDFRGRWSPDGSRIALLSTRGGQTDIWILSAGESDIQRVTDNALNEGGPQWARDGHSIVANIPLGQAHLYAVPLAGGATVQLTSGDWSVGSAEVSPDGSRVVFTGNKNGDNDIWVVNVAGGEPQLVSGGPGSDGDPSWSPDGKQIVFSSARSGNLDIWIAPATGGAARRLTDFPSPEFTPRWSPDGKTIAFRSGRDSPGTDLWAMPAAGGAATRLTNVGEIGGEFGWSPDSRTLVYDSQGGGTEQVYAVAAAGGAPRVVVPSTSFGPHWSPSGRELNVSKCEAGYCRTEIWSAEGKFLRALNERKTGVWEYVTRWSSDGATTLVNAQALENDGSMQADIRPAAGGASKRLPAPTGFQYGIIGFSAGDKSAIVAGGPYGNALTRLTVPAAVKR